MSKLKINYARKIKLYINNLMVNIYKKFYIDSVATHLSKALHGGDLRVFKQEDQPFPTINRRTDITVKSLDNLTKPNKTHGQKSY